MLSGKEIIENRTDISDAQLNGKYRRQNVTGIPASFMILLKISLHQFKIDYGNMYQSISKAHNKVV